MRMIAIVCLLLLNLTAQDLKVAIFNPSSSGKVSSRASKALLNTLKKEINSISVYNVVESINEIGKIIKELEISLNPKVKKYSSKNKIYPKGRSTMGLPGTRAQKGKKKWKQTK